MTPERLSELSQLEAEINLLRKRVGIIGARAVELVHLQMGISRERLGSGIANVKHIRFRLRELSKTIK